jgi:serine/threonine-protein kinase
MNIVLEVISGPHLGREYVFDRHATFSVGRSPETTFPVPDDPFFSRNHFLIEFNPPLCLLKDTGSTNGTKVNGQRVSEVRLRDGDVISAGKSAFRIRVDATAEQLGAIRCRVCRAPAGDDVAVLQTSPGDEGEVTWLCRHCVEQSRRFPPPPSGYWIERRIGGGGMGEVFKARHLETGRVVAIKMMIPSAASSDRARKYFQREISVLHELRHPNIVQFYEMHEALGIFHLVMEFVDGQDALAWAEGFEGGPPVAAVAEVGLQLLAALDHAHAKGFVHRDVKPSNLLLTGPRLRPRVKLSDFGLAKSFRDDAGFTGLTHQGDVGGSVGFVSPDHIRDFREVREPADIYGAGVTLYYLLTGEYPYLDFDPASTKAYAMILEHPCVPARVRRTDVPDGLDRLLRKSLEKHPRDRWKSARAMADALRPFAEPPAA